MSSKEESFSKDAPPPRAFVGSKFKGRTNKRQVKWASSLSWSWHRQKKMEKHSPWKTHLSGSKDNSFYPVIHETQQCVCKGCYFCAITAMNIEAHSLSVHLWCSAGKHNVTEGPEDGSDPDTPGSRLPRNSQSSADFSPWASAVKAGPPFGSSPHGCTHWMLPHCSPQGLTDMHPGDRGWRIGWWVQDAQAAKRHYDRSYRGPHGSWGTHGVLSENSLRLHFPRWYHDHLPLDFCVFPWDRYPWPWKEYLHDYHRL